MADQEKRILGVIFLLEQSLRAIEAHDNAEGWNKVRKAQQMLGQILKTPGVIVEVHTDLTSALTNMGFSPGAARMAANNAVKRLGENSGLEPMILEAIRELTAGRNA